MRLRILLVLGGLFAGGLLGLALAGGSGFRLASGAANPVPRGAIPPVAPDPGADRSVLAEILQAEVEARRDLEAEVELLRMEVAWLRSLLEREAPEGTERKRPEDATGDNAADWLASESELSEPRTEAAWFEEALSRRRSFFDEEALVELGIDPAEAARLRERFEEVELERLFVNDSAAREGWGLPRRRQELRELSTSLREELGDEGYDLVLYAAGRNNRVSIGDLLTRSPAAQAGFLRGDLLLSYGDQRLFSAQELRRATAQGQAGASTRVEVMREGRVVTLFVPRGPLGVRLVPTRRAPEPTS